MSELEKQCLSLSKEKRERLIKVLKESLDDTKMSLDEIHKAVVKVVGFEFILPGRDLYMSVARTIFTHYACLEGYTESKIGEYLKKDHSTVHMMKGKMRDWLERPRLYSIENEWCEKVKKELYETD